MRKSKRILNIISFILIIVVNTLAQIIPLNGQTTGEVSKKFPILFTPPDYVFFIWIVIYVLLFLFVIYQALPKQENNIYVHRIGYLFFLSSLFNIGWIFTWHYEYFLISLILILGLFISLALIYSRLDIGEKNLPISDKIFINIPFSIYLAWITIAVFGNLNIVLYSKGFEDLFIGQELWTILLLIIGTIISLFILFSKKDIFYSLVFIWAYIGIGIKNKDIIKVRNVAFGLAGFIALMIIFVIINKIRKKRRYMFLD